MHYPARNQPGNRCSPELFRLIANIDGQVQTPRRPRGWVVIGRRLHNTLRVTFSPARSATAAAWKHVLPAGGSPFGCLNVIIDLPGTCSITICVGRFVTSHQQSRLRWYMRTWIQNDSGT